MSVNSISAGVLPYYGSLRGNNSPTAEPGAFAETLPERTPAAADSAVDAEYRARTGAGLFQSELEQKLRASGVAAGAATGGVSGPDGGQTAAAIALYKRVSQIGGDETTASELLRRWNSIVQSGQDVAKDPTVSSQAFSHGGATRFESGILDLTA
jgi:hypothetical protein